MKSVLGSSWITVLPRHYTTTLYYWNWDYIWSVAPLSKSVAEGHSKKEEEEKGRRSEAQMLERSDHQLSMALGEGRKEETLYPMSRRRRRIRNRFRLCYFKTCASE